MILQSCVEGFGQTCIKSLLYVNSIKVALWKEKGANIKC